MIVSFVNNPRGLNYLQVQSFICTLDDTKDITQFNHGGDRQDGKVHDIVRKIENVKINIYPLVSTKVDSPYSDAIYHPSSSVSARNRTLVDIADIIIAAPMMVFEFEDSAAWRTVNYAVSKDKEIIILSTKGTIYSVWKNAKR